MYSTAEGDRKLGQRNQTLAFARAEAKKMASNYNRITKEGNWEPTRNPLRTEHGWQACIELWTLVG